MQWPPLLSTALLWSSSQTRLAHASTGSATLTFNPLGSKSSAGGKAQCTTGMASVQLNATNLAFINIPDSSQFGITGSIFDALQINSTWTADHTNGTIQISGPFNIYVEYCLPVDDASAKKEVDTVQVLTHGLGLDRSYWDIEAGYSYVDAAADAGHATLNYDRLGAGESDHPDPIEVIQSFVHVEVLAALVKGLKAGIFASKPFESIACVGHSYGSFIQIGHDTKYPNACNTSILTGIGADFSHVPQSILTGSATIAHTVDPGKYAALPAGYLINPTAVSLLIYYHYPFYDPELFTRTLPTARSTYSLADIPTSGLILTPAPAFTGAVQVVLGQHDYTFCMGDCAAQGGDAAGDVAELFYPHAKQREGYLVAGAGHSINGHFAAGEAFGRMLGFVEESLRGEGGRCGLREKGI